MSDLVSDHTLKKGNCLCAWHRSDVFLFSRLTGMPKEKYEPPDPRRLYTIMSAEEAASGKKSHWAELEITGLFFCMWL